MNETQLGIAIPETAILTMKNIISAREVEKAVTLGYVFTSDEALKVGLVDEIATDKADAIAKCEAFLLKFRKVPPLARGLTKQYFRKDIADKILNNKQRDVDVFVKAILDPKSQNVLKSFLSR
jgi:3,2-trans-enoyl-CoA isomerase